MDELGILTDRSRIECWESCPRKRFLEYEWKGRGIQRANIIPPAWELLTGIKVHEGIECILLAIIAGEPWDSASIAAQAVMQYRTEIEPSLMTIEDEQSRSLLLWEADQQYDLVRALVIAWATVSLPRYLQNYRPITVEKEQLLTLEYNGQKVTIMTRTDILSQRLTDNGHVVHNLKTSSRPDNKWKQGFRYDQQVLMEAYVCEEDIKQQVGGVVIHGLAKGSKKEYPEGSGKWQHSSPLIYCWYRPGDPPMTEPEFHARYNYTCTEPHLVGKPNKAGVRKECPGGVNHKLSGVYKERVESVYPGGIPAWIAYLWQVDPELVREQMIELEPISRSAYEIERWKRMVIQREVEISKHAQLTMEAITSDNPSAVNMLDYYFPMHTGHSNCLWPRPCQFLDCCWGTADPDDPDRFKPRIPNHYAEKVRHGLVQIEKGTNGSPI